MRNTSIMSAYGGGYSDTTKPRTSAYLTKSKAMEKTVVSKLPTDEEIRNSWKNVKSINDRIKQPVNLHPMRILYEEEKKQMKDRISNVKNAQQSYILSSLYKQRASKYKNPTEAATKALQALKETKVDVNPIYMPQAFPSKKNVALQPDSQAPVIAHELGHITGARSPGAEGTAMVLNFAEQGEIMSRNKHVQKLAKEIGRPILTSRQLPIEIDVHNTHTYSPWENKADIEGLRYIFFNNGITKKYGDNITPEQFKKALQNPKIANELQIKRLKANFEDKDIIELNNILAKTNTAEKQNLA